METGSPYQGTKTVYGKVAVGHFGSMPYGEPAFTDGER